MTAHKVGDTLWWVGNDNARSQKEVTIVKAGRTWLHLNNGHRLCPNTLLVDGKGYSSPATCYVSQETYKAHLGRNQAWEKLRRKLDGKHRVPNGLSTENINKALELLGF